MLITVYTHFFTVTGHDGWQYKTIKEFAFRLADYDYRGVYKARAFGQKAPAPTLKKLYAAFTENRREWRFHIHSLKDFRDLLDSRGIPYDVEEAELYKFNPIKLSMMDWFVARENQVPLINYLVSDGVTKVLNLQTGQGKTACSLAAACQIGGKILVSIEARFFNLWAEAFDGSKKVIDIDSSKEVVYIQGSKDLKKAMDMAMNGQLDDVKVFVCSSRTLINFIELYEKFNGELEGVYPCSPEQLYELFDVGTRIKDEVHLSLWANFKEELYMHTGKSISLSATLEDGSFLDKVLAVMFPKSIRSPEVEYLKYIDVYSLMYTLEKPDQAKTSHRGSTDYSHNAYEDYILKNKKMYNSYSRIMVEWLSAEYLSIRKGKQRACIFVSSVEMATAIWDTLRKTFPQVTFARYAASAGDIYDEAKQADVLVTTVQSFGTGFDLEDLICSLMTTNLRSQKTNLQVLGRLRVLKNYPGQTPKFYYLICSDIKKHLAYHEEKKLQFHGKVKSHQNRFLRIIV